MYKEHVKLLISKYGIFVELENMNSFLYSLGKINQNATATTTYLHVIVRRLVKILHKNSRYVSLRIILSITIS